MRNKWLFILLFPAMCLTFQAYSLDAVPGNLKTKEAEAVLRAAEEKKADLFINLHSQPNVNYTFVTVPSACCYPSQIKVTHDLARLCCNALKSLGDEYEPGTSVSARIDINASVQFCSGAAGAIVEFAAREGSFDRILETGYVVLETMLRYGMEKPYCDRKNWLANNQQK